MYTLKPISREPILLEHVLYDFGSANLKESSRRALDTTLYRLMLREPGLKIEIAAHTDSVGSAEDNLTLSQARAESVVNYLIRRGIKATQLEAKGYGEEKPVAPNSLPNGKDNPEGRALNRRTEFRIIDSF